jgi:putative FmdB family regulatory protein
MPTYSYHCAACGHSFDKVQRITEDAIKTCEACGADQASRLITSGNFMLKGSGWYGDLYSGASNKKAEGAPSGDATACAKPTGCDGAGTCAAPSASTTTPTTSSTSSSSSTSAN